MAMLFTLCQFVTVMHMVCQLHLQFLVKKVQHYYHYASPNLEKGHLAFTQGKDYYDCTLFLWRYKKQKLGSLLATFFKLHVYYVLACECRSRASPWDKIVIQCLSNEYGNPHTIAYPTPQHLKIYILFHYRCFMVDKDLKLLNAIREAYRDVEVAVILCWFHVLQVSSKCIDIHNY